MTTDPISRDDQSGTDPVTHRSRPSTAVRRGVTGGLVATAVMTAYRLPIFRSLPPTAEFWATYVASGDAEQYRTQGAVLHVLYGAVAGGLFGPVFSALDRQRAIGRDRLGVVAGVAYGLVLSVVGTRIVFRRLLSEDLDPDEVLVFHVGHAIYGVTLGTWISTRERFGGVYD